MGIFFVLLIHIFVVFFTARRSLLLHFSFISDLTFYDPEVLCKIQPSKYDCDEKGLVSAYYYDIKLQDCRSYEFGKCKLNVNQFTSLSDCHNTCRESGIKPIPKLTPSMYCRLQPDFGNCNSYHPMWYFELDTRTCRGFSYSGCGGNFNRFSTSKICSDVCQGMV
ncbi:unnamed protein product [Parnassius mnemosyne]|uniref:BPTI/Kunitz inhibitor domain-containing protein n=1 Tax=Parnassius mnemosyne TaxID=213953 RepID=A0AAV1L014_9NEOP